MVLRTFRFIFIYHSDSFNVIFMCNHFVFAAFEWWMCVECVFCASYTLYGYTVFEFKERRLDMAIVVITVNTNEIE